MTGREVNGLGEDIGTFADGSNQVVGKRLAVDGHCSVVLLRLLFGRNILRIVEGVIEGGTNELGHGAINYGKALHRTLFHVEDAADETSTGGNDAAAQLKVERLIWGQL